MVSFVCFLVSKVDEVLTCDVCLFRKSRRASSKEAAKKMQRLSTEEVAPKVSVEDQLAEQDPFHPLALKEKTNELAHQIQSKLVRRPKTTRAHILLPCPQRLAIRMFPMLRWSARGGGELRAVIKPSGDDDDFIDTLVACLREKDDNFVRRFCTHSNIVHEDGSTGRHHDCTTMICDGRSQPVLVSWTLKSTSQTLPDLQQVKVECGFLRFSFYLTPSHECDTTDNCVGKEQDNFDDLGAEHNGMRSTMADLKSKVVELTRDNDRLRFKVHAFQAQLHDLGVPPTQWWCVNTKKFEECKCKAGVAL